LLVLLLLLYLMHLQLLLLLLLSLGMCLSLSLSLSLSLLLLPYSTHNLRCPTTSLLPTHLWTHLRHFRLAHLTVETGVRAGRRAHHGSIWCAAALSTTHHTHIFDLRVDHILMCILLHLTIEGPHRSRRTPLRYSS
jgi:hypothetical protein